MTCHFLCKLLTVQIVWNSSSVDGVYIRGVSPRRLLVDLFFYGRQGKNLRFNGVYIIESTVPMCLPRTGVLVSTQSLGYVVVEEFSSNTSDRILYKDDEYGWVCFDVSTLVVVEKFLMVNLSSLRIGVRQSFRQWYLFFLSFRGFNHNLEKVFDSYKNLRGSLVYERSRTVLDVTTFL